MIYRKEIKLGLKVSFIILQTFVLLAGVGTMTLVLTLYLRMSTFVNIPFRELVPVLAACVFSLLNGTLGYLCVSSRKKIRIFLFYMSLAALLNIQIVLALKSNRLVEDNKSWLNSSWSMFSDPQRSFVQGRFQCCGFETLTDRSGGGCPYKRNCLDQFVQISKALRARSQKFLLVLFFIETLGFCILSFLKFGR